MLAQESGAIKHRGLRSQRTLVALDRVDVDFVVALDRTGFVFFSSGGVFNGYGQSALSGHSGHFGFFAMQMRRPWSCIR